MRRLATCALLLLLLAASPAAAADAGSTLLVSRPDGTDAVPPPLENAATTPGALSDDGRYAVFASDADGLDPGANQGVRNLYLRDRQSHTTTLVSRSDGLDGVGFNARAHDPAIAVQAADGHVLVAFESDATNVTDHDTGAVIKTDRRATQIWVRDVTAGTTKLVSRADGRLGAVADEDSHHPAIADSAGGPLVAFDTRATNLGANGVLLRTVSNHTTQQVSCPNLDCAHPGPSDSFDPDIEVRPGIGSRCSGDPFGFPCVEVAFASHDKSLVKSPFSVVWVAAAIAPITATEGIHATPFQCCTAQNVVNNTLGSGDAGKPTFSGNGDAVAYLSSATNLGATVPAGVQQAYAHSGSTNILLSRATGNGEPANANVTSVALGGGVDLQNARAVFTTSASNLGGHGTQTYVREVKGATTSTTALVSRAAGPGGVEADGDSVAPPAVSADATTALFATNASNLGDGDPGGFASVHTRELTTEGQALEFVSRPSGSDKPTASGIDNSTFGASHSVVSASGRYVAFNSDSDSLSPIDDNRVQNVFVRDLRTGQTILASRATGDNGVPADGASKVAGISADGHRVAFTSDARDLDPQANGKHQAYLRDIDAGTTTLVSRDTAGAPAATGADAESVSADGNAVAVTSGDPLDPAGAGGLQHVYVRDLAAQTTTIADRDSGVDGKVADLAGTAPVIDADGGRVAWVTAARLGDAPDQPSRRIYVRDLRANETIFVSRASGAAGTAADGPSYDPAINAAGDVVAFASESPNLGAGVGAPQVFVRDTAGSLTELVSRSADGGPQLPAEAFAPSIDAGGNRVAFLADGAIDNPPIAVFGAYVRDRAARTTTLAGRADGPAGALADADAAAVAISGSGDCVAFAGPFTNIGDGLASADFQSVHLRVLSGSCPAPEPLPSGGPGEPGGPGHAGGPAGPGGSKPPATPVLTRLKLSPNRFRRGHRTAIVFTLSSAAKVTITFDRLTNGHRKGRACVAHGRGKRCTIVTRAGTLTISGRTGANKVAFSGKLKGKALKTGRYRLTATPLRGKARTTTFAVNAAPKKKRRS